MSEEAKIDKINKVKEITNRVSPTFCLAKWHHVTLYLQTGETHSCYHPAPHKIGLDEISQNPSALHNTEEKKQERKEMLAGVQTKGCQYCWNIENMGTDYISDRHIRNASIITDERFKQCSNKKKWNQDINPEYVEISFGNECNFKCGYCHPKASSRFFNEIKQHGPITSVKNHRCDIDYLKLYEREENNPFVDAWWQWWPEMSKTLSILRITGGEPLMHTSTWRLLDSLKADPLPNLELNINSNLGGKSAIIDKMVENINYLNEKNCIRRFKLFTSIDTWGQRAEYIRTGLDLALWERNFHAYLSGTTSPITFMITFNILSVTTFKTLLQKILEWRSIYRYKNITERRIRFDTPYLKEPLQYDINILPKKEFLPYMNESIDFIKANVDDEDNTKFTREEYEKFRRVVDYMTNTEYVPEKVTEGRQDFYNYFKTLDLRRGTDFKSVFPEMKKFYRQCALLNG
jgi:hypothetical protein